MENFYGGYNPYPYIYIQYSHDDAERVIPIIKALRAKNYNIVFDKNFDEEDRYRYLNVQQITQAAAFLIFYSKSAAKSRLIKECVRFAVPMYNLEKICVCLDETKFGFSFSDLKKNYIILEETETNDILHALRPLIEVYLLPTTSAFPNKFSSQPDELQESEDADELQELNEAETDDEPEEIIAEANEAPATVSEDTVENNPPEEPRQPEAVTDRSHSNTELTEASDELNDEMIQPASESRRAPIQPESSPIPSVKNELPSVNDLPADAPEAFPDFEMSDDYDEEEDSFGIPDYFKNIPTSLPFPRFNTNAGTDKRSPVKSQPVPAKPEPEPVPAKPEPEPVPAKPEPDRQNSSELLWNDLRRKMHVRAIQKTKFYITADYSKTEQAETPDPESLELTYPQDDTIETITINYPTDEDIPEYTPAPEPINLSGSHDDIKEKTGSELDISEITHKPEPVEPKAVLRERSATEYAPKFTENPPPSEVLPLPVNEPQAQIGSTFAFNPTRTPENESFAAAPEPDDEPEDIADESIDGTDSDEDASAPEESYSRYQPDSEPEPEPEPEPELNSYEYFTRNVLSEMDSDSQWNGKSFFSEPDPEPEPEPEPVKTVNDLGDDARSLEKQDKKTGKKDAAPETEEDEFKQYEKFIESKERKDSEGPQQVDIKTQILIKAAEQGNADAQYKLGLSYEHGDRVQQNYVKAAHWYILSSNRGNANAQYNLANMYEQGLGVSKNLREAADLYKSAAEQGHSNAQLHYGLCLRNGSGIDENPEEAIKWFIKASEKGNAAAIYNLGICFEFGDGVEKDLSHALQLYLASANQNYADAQNALANCYMSGTGVPANYTEAVRWYSKAARGGNVAAQFNIGFCCENGLGIDKNSDMAYRFYRIAADNGSESAIRRLRELGFIKDTGI